MRVVDALLFILGTTIGSFLNVVALRFNTGLSLSGRSSCSSCGKNLRFWELVPILSFILLKARCARCQSRISSQYPLVELWTGLIFVTVFDPSLLLISNVLILTVFSLFIVITVYDMRHKIIPDTLVYLAILLSTFFRLIEGGGSLDYLAGPLFALFFAAIWFFSKGRAMGFGDVKLALAIGLLLGGSMGFSALVLSFWIGAAFGILSIAIERLYPLFRREKRLTIKGGAPLTLKSEIPFAPFLVLGAWMALVLQLNLLYVTIF